ncbi:hypothetical protein AMECASPLE_021386 [Ameca splendens]|uniref:Secreted protein n=1 Tax=Ameca splendens TaxID=208324 RepID=A0ABV0ZZH9_9TELE
MPLCSASLMKCWWRITQLKFNLKLNGSAGAHKVDQRVVMTPPLEAPTAETRAKARKLQTRIHHKASSGWVRNH